MNITLRFFFCWCWVTLFCLLIAPAHAQIYQQVGISGSPNPVGSGARALGMGGAFIGVADDATAASWNPGGLIQLETPEISAVVSYTNRREKRSFDQNPDASDVNMIELCDLNYLSLAYPFEVNTKNMIISLNYQTLYDFNKEIQVSYYYFQPFPGPEGNRSTSKEIDGYIKALSPAFAIQVTPDFSLGFTFNWYSDDIESQWKTTYTDRLNGLFAGNPYFSNRLYKEEYQFNGYNFNIGFMWNVNSSLTLGAVYKSPFSADVHYKEEHWTETSTQALTYFRFEEDQTMEMPSSYGVGVAWRFSDVFTMDMDVYRTDWQDYVIRQADGTELSPITSQPIATTDTQPTHQIRWGGEYLFIFDRYVVPVRGGLFYDPEPTAHNPDDFYGFSLGSGIAYKRVVFDIAYQYRWGNDVRDVRLGQEVVGQDVQQHLVYMSLIIHF